jgi:hypothetical protein
MFHEAHRTGSNKTVLIAQMDDEHLLKMIAAIVVWAERATSQFHRIIAQIETRERAGNSGRAVIAEAQREMYGLPDLPDRREAAVQYAKGMNSLCGRLEPYLLEVWTRQMSEPDQALLDSLRSRWRMAVGRSRPLPNPERLLLATPDLIEDDACDLPF